ncbi:MAG: polymerase, sigma-24 subunit, subfamily [Frondihabitans sp.]|nr:polymerase, sigma-24 subunit, subfamily [Frondihabitans sp.]
MTRTEPDLWASSLQGDGDAFGELYDQHRDRVFRHLLRFGESHADAEDATAVVFLELWRRRGSVHVVDDSVLPWLIVTATNVGRNAARSRRRYRGVLLRIPAQEAAADASEDALRRLPLADTDRALARALDELPRVDAQILALTALEGYSLAEAASVLGLTAGAARARLFRARKRLRATLDAPVEEGLLS